MKFLFPMLFVVLLTGAGGQSDEKATHRQYYVLDNYSWICDQPVKAEGCKKKSLYGYSFFSKKSEGGFYYIDAASPGVSYAGKWINEEGLVGVSSFRPVDNWNIKYLVVNVEFLMDLYVFDRSGKYVIHRYFEDGSKTSYKKLSQLYQYGDLIVKTEFSENDGVPVFAEALGIMIDDVGPVICPVEYYRKRSTCKGYVPPVNKYTRWDALNYLQFTFSDSVKPIYYAGNRIELSN